MDAEKFTINFESQLVSTSMTANGGHKITLRINPEDVIHSNVLSPAQSASNGRVRSLMTQSPNTRYMCVLVQLGEESDEPVVQEDALLADKAIATFSMLCRSSEDWHRWLGVDSEIDAVSEVKNILGIESRKDLRKDPRAVAEFNQLLNRFYNE